MTIGLQKPLSFLGDDARDQKPPAFPEWQRLYWLVAALPALLIFFSDVLEISFYQHARAPNAGPVGQISLMLIFYAVWPLVPWMIWQIVKRHDPKNSGQRAIANGLVPKLAFAALAANLIHMSVLALVLRVLYSPPGWGINDFMFSVTELWVQHGGIWFSVYAGFCAVIYWMLRGSGAQPTDRLIYEIRRGNRIVPLDISTVSWIEASGNYAQLHTENGIYLVRKALACLEKETAAYNFARSHRGALVNLACVEAIVQGPEKGTYQVALTTGRLVPLSRRRLAWFRGKLM